MFVNSYKNHNLNTNFYIRALEIRAPLEHLAGHTALPSCTPIHTHTPSAAHTCAHTVLTHRGLKNRETLEKIGGNTDYPVSNTPFPTYTHIHTHVHTQSLAYDTTYDGSKKIELCA